MRILAGLWVANGLDGGAAGLVLAEAVGPSVILTEVPTARSWGSAAGVQLGLSLQGVDLRDGRGLQWASLQRQDPFASTSDARSLVWGSGEVWSRASEQRRESEEGAGIHARVLLPAERSVKSHDTTTTWPDSHRPGRAVLSGYRYLRLVVNETLSSSSSPMGRVALTELVFYEGRVRLYPQPELPLTGEAEGGRYITGYHATCSSSASPATACYKALDHDWTRDSTWVSADVSRRGPYLSTAQSLTLDLGPDRLALPTALRLACPLDDCPRAFQVLGR